MTTAPAPPSVPADRAAQRSTRTALFILGLGMSAWAPLVPFVKARAHLNEATLGLLLLCLGAGSIVTLPLAGRWVARHGSRRVLVAATLSLCLALPVLAAASDIRLLVPALLLFGAATGAFDCAVNIQAVIVERESGRPLMSGFHGLFSVGGLLGAGGASILLGWGLSPLLATLGIVAAMAALLAVAAPHFLSRAGPEAETAFVAPHGVVLLLGALCFVVFMTEGSVLDWSAVFLSAEHVLPPARAGLGYAAFALLMTVGRLTGDRLVRRVGGRTLLLLGGLCAAAGLALAALVPTWPAGLLGYALVGAGCANIVPVLFTAAGRQQAVPEHVAIPAVSTLGYAGILSGPALIGFVAHATSLSHAFLLVALLLVGVALSHRHLPGGG